MLQSPKRSFFLFGPRGAGKSTWIRHAVDAVKTFDLLSEELYQRLLVTPGAFAAELRVVEAGSWVVVDEIQRIPALLNEVHRFIEERQLRFVLSGSSARRLKQAGVNLLAGRAVRRYMHPFVPEEIGDSFSLDAALRFGTLPIVWDQADDRDREETLRAYAQLYLKEEIQAEALVRDLPAFARFLPVAALCHGQTINVSSLARDAGVARTTVAGYLGILEDTLLCFQLAGCEPRLRVKERKHPKLYWADPGIVRAVRGGADATIGGGAWCVVRRSRGATVAGLSRLSRRIR